MPDPIFGGAFDDLFARGGTIGLGNGDQALADSEYKAGIAWTVAGCDQSGRSIRVNAVQKISFFESDGNNSATFTVKCGNGTSPSIHAGERFVIITDGTPNGISGILISTDPGDSGGGGGSGITWGATAENQEAAAGEGWDVDTTAGNLTLTLPENPDVFAEVHIRNSAQSFATHALTIGRNGSTIMGLSQDMTVNTDGVDFYLWFNGTTWQLPGAQL